MAKNSINQAYYDDSGSFDFSESHFKNINIWAKNGINRVYFDYSDNPHFQSHGSKTSIIGMKWGIFTYISTFSPLYDLIIFRGCERQKFFSRL